MSSKSSAAPASVSESPDVTAAAEASAKFAATRREHSNAQRLKNLARRDPRLRVLVSKVQAADKAIATIATAEARVLELTAALHDSTGEIGEIRQKLSAADETIGTHQAEAKTTAAALAALRGELASAQAELATAEESLGKAAARIGELEKADAAGKLELTGLRKELAEALKKAKPAVGQ